jgi:hypothetical protein
MTHKLVQICTNLAVLSPNINKKKMKKYLRGLTYIFTFHRLLKKYVYIKIKSSATMFLWYLKLLKLFFNFSH